MPHSSDLSELFDEPAASSVATDTAIAVSNVHPTITSVPYRIAIIGEAPGVDEVEQGKPFVGYSGQLLERFLSRFNLLRDACFIGNVCQHRPPRNQIASFDWDGPQIQSGLAKLTEDLTRFRPNVVLLLGGSALHAFKAPNVIPRKRKTKDGTSFVSPNSISDWRGSFFLSHMQAPCPAVKCIAAFHPAACLRQYEWTPLLMLDISRAQAEATSSELTLPARRLIVGTTFEEVIRELDQVIAAHSACGTDIEGYWNGWWCISFAPNDDYSFIVPLTNMAGQSYWSVDQEYEILRRTVAILSNPQITKTWQNGLYDRFATQFGYKIIVRGPSHDIMLKHWELYCELEKALSVQCSIYTKEPFYKSDRKSDDIKTFHEYCCRDSAVTKEIDTKLDKWLGESSKRHYEFNLSLLNALLYMECRGIRYNKPLAHQRLKEIKHSIHELQFDLDRVAGFGVKTNDKVVLRALVRDKLCWKRDSSIVRAGCQDDYDWAMRILHSETSLSKAELGQLSDILELSLNIRSPNFKDYLYETLKCPPQKDKQTKQPTADYEALITLVRKCPQHSAIPIAITIGELRTRSQMLEISTDSDGRIRSSYNEVGSETGRVTSLTSPTGSGYNLQTIPDENPLKPVDSPLRGGMRDLLIADDGCYLAKFDLKGADGWTVGANLASLGYPEMLDDLRFGIKPAARLCYMMRHGLRSLAGFPRDRVLDLLKEIKKDEWDYFAYKQCIWGFCYGMGAEKASSHVHNVSEGTVLLPSSDMEKAKAAVFSFYHISAWHRAVEQRMFKQPYPPKFVSPSGHVRKFFGRKTDIIGQVLAHEPQSITTYATNMAVRSCWFDPDNRVYSVFPNTNFPRVRLRVEPLHQVHDEFLCQFRVEDTTWAIGKIKQWFNNPITIAGVQVTIPFEGSYGTDWAMSKDSKKGTI